MVMEGMILIFGLEGVLEAATVTANEGVLWRSHQSMFNDTA
jgi:hypothetical protein